MRIIKGLHWVIFVIILIAGCAKTFQQNIKSTTEFDKVYSASLQALQEIGFGVTSTDRQSGFITAKQLGAMGSVTWGSGESVIINLQIKQDGNGAIINVAVVPPSDLIGNVQGIYDKFISALQKKVGDVETF